MVKHEKNYKEDKYDKHDKRRKYPRDFWEEFLNEFSSEFMTMRKQMDRFLKDTMNSFDDESFQKRPFVYGFSFRVGPDGIPHFEQFGDTKFSRPKGPFGKDKESKREPLTDIIEAEDHVVITMELPGIEKKDINLEVVEDSLVIDVDTAMRKYHKELRLPENLDMDTIEANYKNGVLDIKIQRKKDEIKQGRKIEIK